MSRIARILHIQTGAERDNDQPGGPYNEAQHTRQQQTGNRIQATRDQIDVIRAEQDAAWEHYQRTGRYPN
jgi:hypothetical protein